ncbi:hypothetical protein IMSAGC005_03121 [Lachnospiraceae bacterium]|nr:hypothetical protein IMSAGC005_03121 [Lachnospiraceae bacterium]
MGLAAGIWKYYVQHAGTEHFRQGVLWFGDCVRRNCDRKYKSKRSSHAKRAGENLYHRSRQENLPASVKDDFSGEGRGSRAF